MKTKPLVPLLLLLALASLPAAAVDPFYLGLLRDGQLAYDRKDYPGAVRELRLACFGMLDEPKALADCLARLALAQDRAEDLEGFRATFQRLVEIEERFGAYTQDGVVPELRAVLEPRLVARLPAATLEGVPAFRHLGAKKPATTANPSREQRTGRDADRRPPPSPIASPPAASRETAPAAPGPAEPGNAPGSPPAPEPPKPLSDAERKTMDQARQLLSRESSGRELRQAYQEVREIADAHLDSKEAQHLAAEAAYRVSRWSDAAAYFRRGGDPGESQPERLFYMAVSLYESGDAANAADALRRALPNLRRTPYVDSYAKKILGQ